MPLKRSNVNKFSEIYKNLLNSRLRSPAGPPDLPMGPPRPPVPPMTPKEARIGRFNTGVGNARARAAGGIGSTLGLYVLGQEADVLSGLAGAYAGSPKGLGPENTPFWDYANENYYDNPNPGTGAALAQNLETFARTPMDYAQKLKDFREGRTDERPGIVPSMLASWAQILGTGVRGIKNDLSGMYDSVAPAVRGVADFLFGARPTPPATEKSKGSITSKAAQNAPQAIRASTGVSDEQAGSIAEVAANMARAKADSDAAYEEYMAKRSGNPPAHMGIIQGQFPLAGGSGGRPLPKPGSDEYKYWEGVNANGTSMPIPRMLRPGMSANEYRTSLGLGPRQRVNEYNKRVQELRNIGAAIGMSNKESAREDRKLDIEEKKAKATIQSAVINGEYDKEIEGLKNQWLETKQEYDDAAKKGELTTEILGKMIDGYMQIQNNPAFMELTEDEKDAMLKKMGIDPSFMQTIISLYTNSQ